MRLVRRVLNWRIRMSQIPIPSFSCAHDDVSERLLSFYTHIFVGRLAQRELIQSLMSAKRAGYFLVRGIGGSGKSALLINLVHKSKKRLRRARRLAPRVMKMTRDFPLAVSLPRQGFGRTRRRALEAQASCFRVST